MKRFVLILCMFFVACLASKAQDTTFQQENKKFRLGVGMGTNYSMLMLYQGIFMNDYVSNGWGFSSEISVEYIWNERLSLTPIIGLTTSKGKFNQYFGKKINQNQFKEIGKPYHPLSTSLDLALHFLIKTSKSKWKAYFLGGPRYQIPFRKDDGDVYYQSEPNFGLDWGIGLEKICGKIKFTPELRYMQGLTDVSGYPKVKGVNLNSLSIILGLKI